jgi:hypothetical protein
MSYRDDPQSLSPPRSRLSPRRWQVMACGVAALLAGAAPASSGALVDALLDMADQGTCIEDAVFVRIRSQPAQASHVLEAAIRAWSVRREQQAQLGCDGDIAAQAIAAGADPQRVLDATAAGL